MRNEAHHVSMIKLYEDVHDIKRLDKHVEEFFKLVKKDAKEHDFEKLHKHAKEFEHEIHLELDKLMDLTKKDLAIYKDTLKKLIEFKVFLANLDNRDSMLEKTFASEIKYADILVDSAKHKLSTLNSIFKRLKGKYH